MRRVLLIGLAALALAPAVFADNASRAASAPSARMTDALSAWCAGRDNRGCVAWRAEQRLEHVSRAVEGGLRVSLRREAAQLHVIADRTADGWLVTGVERVRTVRCGTPAFGVLSRSVRSSAPPAWVARIDGCRPDARAPLEVERRALRPIAVRGRVPPAVLRAGDDTLTLRWTAEGWQPAAD